MVTWTAARAAQQHARPAGTAEPAVAPGTGGAEAPWLLADGCVNLAFMISASPGPGRPGRDVHHLVECRRSRTKGPGRRWLRRSPGWSQVTGSGCTEWSASAAMAGPTMVNPRYELLR